MGSRLTYAVGTEELVHGSEQGPALVMQLLFTRCGSAGSIRSPQNPSDPCADRMGLGRVWRVVAQPMPAVSNREQSVEEFSVAFEGNPKIFSRGFLTATPLLLEPRTCL